MITARRGSPTLDTMPYVALVEHDITHVTQRKPFAVCCLLFAVARSVAPSALRPPFSVLPQAAP